ncbi:hypothetical protein HDU98_011125 [Podochytrium sp. JEL0797]|nr:hypothetical protein HDU98_011125 [Podochytrium sp. JEL0797]
MISALFSIPTTLIWGSRGENPDQTVLHETAAPRTAPVQTEPLSHQSPDTHCDSHSEPDRPISQRRTSSFESTEKEVFHTEVENCTGEIVQALAHLDILPHATASASVNPAAKVFVSKDSTTANAVIATVMRMWQLWGENHMGMLAQVIVGLDVEYVENVPAMVQIAFTANLVVIFQNPGYNLETAAGYQKKLVASWNKYFGTSAGRITINTGHPPITAKFEATFFKIVTPLLKFLPNGMDFHVFQLLKVMLKSWAQVATSTGDHVVTAADAMIRRSLSIHIIARWMSKKLITDLNLDAHPTARLAETAIQPPPAHPAMSVINSYRSRMAVSWNKKNGAAAGLVELQSTLCDDVFEFEAPFFRAVTPRLKCTFADGKRFTIFHLMKVMGGCWVEMPWRTTFSAESHLLMRRRLFIDFIAVWIAQGKIINFVDTAGEPTACLL